MPYHQQYRQKWIQRENRNAEKLWTNMIFESWLRMNLGICLKKKKHKIGIWKSNNKIQTKNFLTVILPSFFSFSITLLPQFLLALFASYFVSLTTSKFLSSVQWTKQYTFWIRAFFVYTSIQVWFSLNLYWFLCWGECLYRNSIRNHHNWIPKLSCLM